ELRGLRLAEQRGAWNGIRGTTRAGRHQERRRRSVRGRWDDLRGARDVGRARRRRHGDDEVPAVRAGRVAEGDVELVVAVRERDLPLLGRTGGKAARRQGSAAETQQSE